MISAARRAVPFVVGSCRTVRPSTVRRPDRRAGCPPRRELEESVAVVVEDAGGDLDVQPLTDEAFMETGLGRHCGTGEGPFTVHGLIQAELVAQIHHSRHQRTFVGARHRLLEALHLGVVHGSPWWCSPLFGSVADRIVARRQGWGRWIRRAKASTAPNRTSTVPVAQLSIQTAQPREVSSSPSITRIRKPIANAAPPARTQRSQWAAWVGVGDDRTVGGACQQRDQRHGGADHQDEGGRSHHRGHEADRDHRGDGEGAEPGPGHE